MRGWRILAAWGAMLLVAAPVWAVNPPGGVGKVTERHDKRIVGREERGNTFRRPGSVLEAARTDPSPVDPHVLAARQRALYEGATFTDRIPGLGGPADAAGPRVAGAAPPADRHRPAQTPAAAAAKPWAALQAILLAVGALIILGLLAWSVRGRRRPQPAPVEAESAAAPRRRMNARADRWIQRDLAITMGHRED